MDDDDDAFLYGSDTETKDSSGTTAAVADFKTNITQETTKEDASEPIASNTQQEGNDAEEGEYDEDDEEDDDSDSDSDVEFIIGSTESKVNNIPATQLKVMNGEVVAASDVTDTATKGETSSEIPNTIQITTIPILTSSNGLDINKVGIYNELPITQLSLDELKDKPWRLPGADISDYFNFGFDEISWRAYCAKHEKIRVDFNLGKLMSELLASGSIPPTLGQMMPNGGNNNSSMPPPFMMGMPGMPGMPNFMGMPNMSNMGMPNMGMPNMNSMPGMPNMNVMTNMPPQSISNNGSTTSSISNSANIPNIPNIPNLNSRTTSNTPEPINSKLPHIPSTLRDVRDQADKNIEKGNNGGSKYEDRGEKDRGKGGSGRRRR